jgi:hypothetical protein
MGKKLFLGCTVISFAFLTSTFAAVKDIKVSGDITVQAITRDLSLGDDTGNTIDSEDFIFSQTRLRFDADLTEKVSAVVRLINERLWGAENVSNTDIDLDLGYVELKEFLYEPLTLIVGRQNLHYGIGLIVGDPDTNQTAAINAGTIGDLSLRKSFDAIRAILDYSPYTLDLIYAKVNEGNTNIDDDVTLYGANLAYQWGTFNGLTEVYFFASSNARTVTVQDENSDIYVAGARVQFDPNDHLTLMAEGAYQFGDYRASATSHAHLNAWAALLSAEYRFLNDYNGKIGILYALLSGDDVNTNDYEGWDPMFEDIKPGEICNILASNTDAHVIKLTGSYMPREDVTLGLEYWRVILAEKLTTTTYSPLVGPASANTYAIDNSNKVIGDEIILYANYDYTEDVQLKLLGSWFIPGDLFTSANDDVAYSIRGCLRVNF